MKKSAFYIIGCFVLAGILVWLALSLKPKDSPGPAIVLRESPDAQAALRPRIVDEMKTGVASSEAAHQLQGQRSTTGTFMSNPWRGAANGGDLTVVMKVLPDQPVNLDCRYWGSEEAPRVFDIIVGGQMIATQTLDYNMPGHFFDVEYKIPQNLTAGRNDVEIEFRGHPGAGTGGFFGIQILKR